MDERAMGHGITEEVTEDTRGNGEAGQRVRDGTVNAVDEVNG
jgi:hypothetical protein